MNRPMRVTGLFAMVLSIACVGCGPSDPLGRKAISGTVNIDGAPAAEGAINFEPEGSSGPSTGSGSNIVAGKFSMDQEHGLPPGKYRVRINLPKPGTGGKVNPNELPGMPVAPPEELAPPEWNTKSTQTIEVKAEGPFDFPFNVSSKKK